MTATTVPQLPIGATRAHEFDPEDGNRLICAELGEVELYALQGYDGNLTSVGALVNQGDDHCSVGYSAAQLRALIPMLERAADLAEQWAAL
ncbi:hypothetical protein [Mycolicibacter senuensis]|uniref:hypothetical protein n=1 Tax=Mycolicibacter senuensis TaxID=386913 RepID=UPI000DCD8C8F|nr:hypothetical protein [Mycolicibacter senuensis]RAU99469.1 hypothetical protein DQP56_10645 [Mycolicibacter senuensis]